jgi:hypothetical protein
MTGTDPAKKPCRRGVVGEGKTLNIEASIGFGVTAGANQLTVKLMVSRDLNPRSKH